MSKRALMTHDFLVQVLVLTGASVKPMKDFRVCSGKVAREVPLDCQSSRSRMSAKHSCSQCVFGTCTARNTYKNERLLIDFELFTHHAPQGIQPHDTCRVCSGRGGRRFHNGLSCEDAFSPWFSARFMQIVQFIAFETLLVHGER